jgi:tryptophanyl-tRNA synthetase
MYVSLKYTRTVDILKSIIKRLISCFEEIISALVKLNVEIEKIPSAPTNVLARLELIKQRYPHPELEKLISYYLMFRKLDKEEFVRSNEYRRGVRMSVILKHTVVETDIDTVEEYFKATETFLRIAKKIVTYTLERCEDPNIDDIVHGVAIDMEFEKG